MSETEQWELVTDGEYVPQPGVDQLRCRYVNENGEWEEWGDWCTVSKRRSIDGWRGQSFRRQYEFRKLRQQSEVEPIAVDRGERYRRAIVKSLPGPYEGVAVTVDIADIVEAFNMPYMLAQAAKKIMLPGERGSKDRLKDLREAAWHINRQIQIEEAKSNGTV